MQGGAGSGVRASADAEPHPEPHPEAVSILDAVLLISSDLDLRGALDRLVRGASALTGARYGILALIDESGAMADFVVHGLDEDEVAAIPSLPTGHGLLGVLLEESARPIRLDKLTSHPSSIGFPANHPPMETFIGVPVRVDGRVYGNLYLTEKDGGLPFSEQDEKLLDEFALIAGVVIGNARTHSLTTQRHRWLEAGIAMSDALAETTDADDALVDIIRNLLEVAGAIAVGVVHQDEDGLELVAAAQQDVGIVSLDNTSARWREAIAEAGSSGRAVLADHGDGIARVVVPMSSRLLRGQFLLVALEQTATDVGGPDLDLFSAFADQASLALDRAQALAERAEHMLVADRDRIARDLHDTVIQRLFATALQLQGLRRLAVLDEVKERLDESVGELNTTIRDIRSTIFELRHDTGDSLKTAIRALAKEYVGVLGFTPFVRIRGPVDAAVPEEAAEHLLAVLREALSNVARHAEADACIVEVEAARGMLLLRISDNGRGVAEEVNESGLRNVRRRADDLGGIFWIAPEDPHGTLLEWQVPLTR